MTLRSRLFGAFVAVVGVPLLVGLFLLSSALPRAFTDVQGRSVQTTARLAAAQLQAECDRVRAAAEAAGRAVLAVPPGDVAAQEAALESLVERRLAAGLAVTDDGGRVVTAGDVPDDATNCATGGYAAGPVVAVAELRQAGAPAPGRAVAAGARVDRVLEQTRTLAGASAVVLLGDRGTVGQAGTLDDDVRVAARRVGAEPVREGGSVAARAAVPGAEDLSVVVAEPVTGGIDVVRTGVVVVLGAVLLAAAVAPLLARATTRPLEELSEAAARVAAGDLDTTMDVRSRDEVGRLAGAFNAMTDELRASVGQLQASRDELRAGLARLGDTLTSTHDLDRILGVVLETAVATTGAHAGAVLLLDGPREALELAAGRGLQERLAGDRLRVPVGEGVVGRVARDGAPLHGTVAELGASPAEPPADTLVAVPMRGGRGEPLGVLVLYDTRGGAAAQLPTLTTLADQAAVAVENVLLHRDVSRLAVTDGLTGLANYRAFTAAISHEVERSARYGRPLGLLLLDIDHFKAVNDTHGHQRGDAVLVELAARVRAEVRDVDTVARYGGEELVVVLPETDEVGAEQAAERIRRAVRGNPFGAPGQEPVQVTVSLGVAVHRPGGGTAAALLRRADEALYAAKHAGRDTWRSAPPADPERPPAGPDGGSPSPTGAGGSH